jgi:hypothetical protein
MKLLNWAVRFTFAFGIALGLTSIAAYLDAVNNFLALHLIYYCIYHLVINIICFSLFAYCACWFVPNQKKIAGILAAAISISVIALGLYLNFTDKRFDGTVDIRFFINYVGITAGLTLGIYLGYARFKNKGWSPPKNIEEDKEVY